MSASTAGARFAIGLGSNVGDRLGNLRLGLRAVAAHADDLQVSTVYETAPVGFEAQPPFLNACCIGWTRLTAHQLLSELQDAERTAGRRRGGPRFGPRELDLDLLLYGDQTLESDHLILPHPRIPERAFVLVPLAEIAPEWTVSGREGSLPGTVRDLAARVDRTGVRRTRLSIEAR